MAPWLGCSAGFVFETGLDPPPRDPPRDPSRLPAGVTPSWFSPPAPATDCWPGVRERGAKIGRVVMLIYMLI